MLREPKKAILIVEDDLEIRQTMMDVFVDQGCSAHGVSTGRQALDYLQSITELPQLIFLDLMMPEMDGYQFRELQLQDPRISEIPTVILSADRSALHEKQRLKVTKILMKPVELNCLLEIVEQVCV